jgi:hypothetical protein
MILYWALGVLRLWKASRKSLKPTVLCVRLGDVESDCSERVSAADATAFDRND